jgi:hypothetical protein
MNPASEDTELSRLARQRDFWQALAIAALVKLEGVERDRDRIVAEWSAR